MRKVAAQLGLSYNQGLVTAFGNYKGYMVVLKQNQGTRGYTLQLAATPGSGADGTRLSSFCNDLATNNKAVLACTAIENRIEVHLSSIKESARILDEIVGFLMNNYYTNCCASCSTTLNLDFYQINSGVRALCPSCFSEIYGNLANTKDAVTKQKGNLITGIVGAFLGSLIGVALWVGIYYLGYLASITGFVLAVCIMKGYEKFGGKLSILGITVCVLIMLGMGYFAQYLSVSIDAFVIFKEDGATFLNAFRFVGEYLKEDPEFAAQYWLELAQGYLFVAVGAVPAIISSYKSKNASFKAEKLEATV